MDNQISRPTHQVVAERLGLTVATVSRLRSGERLPSLNTMLGIKRLTGWNVDQQAGAKHGGTYASELNRRLAIWHKREISGQEPARA